RRRPRHAGIVPEEALPGAEVRVRAGDGASVNAHADRRPQAETCETAEARVAVIEERLAAFAEAPDLDGTEAVSKGASGEDAREMAIGEGALIGVEADVRGGRAADGTSVGRLGFLRARDAAEKDGRDDGDDR